MRNTSILIYIIAILQGIGVGYYIRSDIEHENRQDMQINYLNRHQLKIGDMFGS